jgi:hypothetical protein
VAAHQGRGHQDEPPYQGRLPSGEPDGDVPAHRVGHDVAWRDIGRLDPRAKPVGCLSEEKWEPAPTKCTEPWQIHEVDGVPLGERRDVSPPPPHLSGEPVHEHDRVAGAHDCVGHPFPSYGDLDVQEAGGGTVCRSHALCIASCAPYRVRHCAGLMESLLMM